MDNFRKITLDDIYTPVYMADRLMCALEEQYFGLKEEAFYKDENAKYDFVRNYEFILAQIWSLGQILFDTRVKLEFALGGDTDVTRAHIKNEIGMSNMHREIWAEYLNYDEAQIEKN